MTSISDYYLPRYRMMADDRTILYTIANLFLYNPLLSIIALKILLQNFIQLKEKFFEQLQEFEGKDVFSKVSK